LLASYRRALRQDLVHQAPLPSPRLLRPAQR